MPQQPMPAAVRRRIERLLKAGGRSNAAIAREVGVSQGSVWNVANAIGLSGSRARKSQSLRRRVHEEVRKGGSMTAIARRLGVSKTTVEEHARAAVPPGDGPAVDEGVPFPDSYERDASEFHIDTAGRWLVLSDVHVPSHNRQAIELAVGQGRREGVSGVLLNGDLLDSHEISDHDKDPSAPRYVREIELGGQFITWLRRQLPHARIVFKYGNHDERADRYIFNRAPALFGLEAVTLHGLLGLAKHGVEWVGGRRVVKLGKLHVIHGHEYKGGGGVSPARWLYLKARSVAICGHFHRTSEYHARDISGKQEAAWSTGCLCDLRPLYMPLNEWGHGWAVVDVGAGGEFGVRNMRVSDGRAV